MGCGSSTAKGRDSSNKLPREAEAFFPPPTTSQVPPQSGSRASPDKQETSPTSSNQRKKKASYVPPPVVVPSTTVPSSPKQQQQPGSTSKKKPYVPPAPLPAAPLSNNGSKVCDDSESSLDNAEALLTTKSPDILGSIANLLASDADLRDIIGEEQFQEAEAQFAERSDTDFYDMSSSCDDMTLHDTPLPCSDSGMRFDELYRLKGVLGTGAFSTVREGFHRSNAKHSFAVKCINRKKLSEEDEAALLDEVAILKELRHVHIIRLYDFFEEPSTYYLVMERMRGGELFDRIVAKAYYNEKEARDTCKILLEAVQYCHENRVAHRDLKPENLLLLSESDDSQVKIADFGFAKRVYEKCSLTTQCGTPGYVAPEILEGTPYDERADMWSVGVILYILLGGYPPFIESTQKDLFRKIRRGEYEFHEEYWGTVSSEAKDLISSLLTVDPDKRLTADDGLRNQWITGDDAKLAKRDLGQNLEKFRNFNAKRKFRAAVSTIIAINKLNSLREDFFTTMKETAVQQVAAVLPEAPQLQHIE